MIEPNITSFLTYTKQEAHLVRILLAKLRGEPVEYKGVFASDWDISNCHSLLDWMHFDYRLKPKELLTVDQWKLIDKRYNWVAMDGDRTVYLFNKKPKKDNWHKVWYNGETGHCRCCLKLDTYKVNWIDSLQERPKETY